MAIDVVNLKLMSGPYLLRRRRSSSDRNAVSLDLNWREIESLVLEESGNQRVEMVGLVQNHASFHLGCMSDSIALAAAVIRALRESYLVIGSSADGGAEGNAKDPAWEAYKRLQSRIGREFQVAMRAHRLVPREQVAAIRQEGDFDVVAAGEAAFVIASVAKTKGGGQLDSSLKLVLENVVDLNTPAAKSGFVLLRAPISHATRYVPVEDIITPSKLKKLRDSHWIEVVIQTETGEPWVGEYSVKLPDGRDVRGITAKDGKIRIESIEAGNCLFSLPGLSSAPPI